MLQRWFQETHSRFWDEKSNKDLEDDENSYDRLPYQIWNVNKYGSCVDAAIIGIMPPPLMELQVIFFILLNLIGPKLELKVQLLIFLFLITGHLTLNVHMENCFCWFSVHFLFLVVHCYLCFWFFSNKLWKFSEVMLLYEFSCFYCWAVKSTLLLCCRHWR